MRHLCRVLPGQGPRLVQPGVVRQQGRAHLLLAGRPARHLHRRQLSLSDRQEVRHLRGRVQERRDRSQPEVREGPDQRGRHHPLTRLRRVRSQGAGRLRLRHHAERRDEPRLRAAAVLDGAVRGRDPAAVEQEASAQHRLDPLRRLPAGQSRRQHVLLGRVLLVHAEAGDPDEGPRRRRQGDDLPQRHPVVRQGLRALLPAGRAAARGPVHPQLRLDRQRGPGDEERHRPLRHCRRA